jgi:hypothetical protein
LSINAFWEIFELTELSRRKMLKGTFAVVKPNQERTWVGRSLWTKAIDRHVVEAISNETTRLHLEESLSGIFVPLMFSSARLLSQHQGWLHTIKTFIETLEHAA